MSFKGLSFRPDRRSVQTTFYHFSERPSGDLGRRGFSQQDALEWALANVYKNRFTHMSENLRNFLVNMLVSAVPLAHHNLVMLAAAGLISYELRNRRIPLNLNPETFANQCEPGTQCISSDPRVISCKQNVASQMDAQNRATFEALYNYVAGFIATDAMNKTPEEIEKARALQKITLLRYIIFVYLSTEKYMSRYMSQ